MAPTYYMQNQLFMGPSPEDNLFEATQFSRNGDPTPSDPAAGTSTIASSVIDLP